MATIKEIAKACNVSIATVSNVLNGTKKVSEPLRLRILETARSMEYVPNYMAKNLKQKETRVIGIIAEDLTVFNCPEIVDGIHAYLEEVNYSFLLGNLRLYKKYGNKFYSTEEYKQQVEEEFKIMQAKQVDGIIYIGAHSRKLNCIPEDLALPVVVAYGISHSTKIPSVIFNDEKAAFEATSLLIEAGHTAIGLITGEERSIHTRERLLGYQRALFKNKILYNPELVFQGNWERGSGYEGAKKLIEEQVTAIFSMNDIMAGGVYDYICEKSLRIGSDLSLIGFDNRELDEAFYPTLTTMALPLHEIGRKAAQCIINRLQGNETPETEKLIRIDCTAIIRNSIGKTGLIDKTL
jgi:DNA-binding LacI/PurR family transcriptional regulator